MRPSPRLGQSSSRAAGMLLGGALLLVGIAAYSHWLAATGYLVLVAAWWALARPRLTTRRVRWPRRRHS